MDEAQDPKCKYVSIWGCFGNLWVCLGHIITGAQHEQRLRGHIVAYASVRDGDAADLGRGQETLLCSADAAAPRRPPRRAPRGRLSQGLPEAGKACQAARATKNGWRGATSWCSSQLQLSRSAASRRTQSVPVRTAPLWWKSGVCPKTVVLYECSIQRTNHAVQYGTVFERVLYEHWQLFLQVRYDTVRVLVLNHYRKNELIQLRAD